MAAKKNGEETGSDLATVDEVLSAAHGMVTRATTTAFANAFAGKVVEQIIKVEDGQIITGIYLGPGPTVDVGDPQNPEIMRPLRTWRVRHPQNPLVVARLLDSAQLGAFFRGIPLNSEVTIAKIGQVNGRAGRRVNQYATGHKPPAVGDAIDVTLAQE